jgi:hypothetical protein
MVAGCGSKASPVRAALFISPYQLKIPRKPEAAIYNLILNLEV